MELKYFYLGFWSLALLAFFTGYLPSFSAEEDYFF
jgi:hypothetical protein